MKKNQKTPPIIGISANLLTIETGSLLGRERTFVGHDYIQAIEQAGGVPLVLPIVKDPACIQRQMELIDGLLLSGGYDIHPLHYGEEPQQKLEAVCPRRDVYELGLIRKAYRLRRPILGICRGLQLLNVAFGGTLYQDIHQALPALLQHYQQAKPDEGTHTVELIKGTLLQNLMHETTLLTNSLHHQAIKDLASCFTANAYTKDGLIEGIEHQEHRFILGVQWHPELMINKYPQMQKLFQALVEASKRWKGSHEAPR